MTKAAEIEVFFDPQKMSVLAGTIHLVKDRCRKSGSIHERSLTTLAPDLLLNFLDDSCSRFP